jgi:hypothetical protein
MRQDLSDVFLVVKSGSDDDMKESTVGMWSGWAIRQG